MSGSITKDQLFRAVLALDVYHRGYNGGLGLNEAAGGQIGNATIGISSKTDTSIGGVDHEDIGFYALEYTLSGGAKVISYRGAANGLSICNTVRKADRSCRILGQLAAALSCFAIQFCLLGSSANALLNCRYSVSPVVHLYNRPAGIIKSTLTRTALLETKWRTEPADVSPKGSRAMPWMKLYVGKIMMGVTKDISMNCLGRGF